MTLINKICLNNNMVSIYRAKNGNTVQIVKDSIPNIFSRTRSVILDSANNPIKCKDVMIRSGKVVSSDVYTITKDGNTAIKDKNGITRLFENLLFVDIASKFLK